MTDIDGRRHRNTLLVGTMGEDVGAKQRAYGNKVLPPVLPSYLPCLQYLTRACKHLMPNSVLSTGHRSILAFGAPREGVGVYLKCSEGTTVCLANSFFQDIWPTLLSGNRSKSTKKCTEDAGIMKQW